MIVYIYGLQDPETKEVRYIGKANNPKVRYRQHIKGGRLNNQHKRGWINALTCH
jgi:excinuclease UvrABC nuclease subunit